MVRVSNRTWACEPGNMRGTRQWIIDLHSGCLKLEENAEEHNARNAAKFSIRSLLIYKNHPKRESEGICHNQSEKRKSESDEWQT